MNLALDEKGRVCHITSDYLDLLGIVEKLWEDREVREIAIYASILMGRNVRPGEIWNAHRVLTVTKW